MNDKNEIKNSDIIAANGFQFSHGDSDSSYMTMRDGCLHINGGEELKSFKQIDGKTIEVFSIIRNNTVLLSNPPQETIDLAIKRIYKAVENKIVLFEKIEGKVIPEKTIPEKNDWDK